tara:strand:+ start:1871 stop:2065 length:195 start_codon:yes stop_codon:yes gene_type:complete
MKKLSKIKTIKKLGMRCISCFLPFAFENLIEQENGDMLCKKCNQTNFKNVKNNDYKNETRRFFY